ncbi:site-specific integrase [Flavobacterium cellulosilyticum]|uniref:Site-specific integrase n=1 Tax=Flavobacterium cellulosilyticum TaxID=2541731 RepID=A0A4R5CN02_9FLAO|nr:site-specific integrase [Flavobacterium cellulosilyticum]TDD99753.1 site-specific integrase [Flavobacterium cellulosilyticum]
MASIKLILRTHQVDQTGHSPLYIRVIKDRKTKFITAGVKLKESEWDEVKQKVKKNHSNSARMNAALSQKIADAEGQVADMERKVKTVSVKKLKEAIKGKEVPNFFEYAKKKLEKIKSTLSYSTFKAYTNQVDKFATFMGTKDVYFDEITVALLNDYKFYLADKLKNGDTTQRLAIIVLGTIFRDAIKEEVIPENMFPFSKITLKISTSKRLFLNKAQIENLTTEKLVEGRKAMMWRDLFLFSIYAGGLRFSDVIEMKYANYNEAEHKINKLIRKTGRVHQFKIGQVAIDILEKYKKENAEHDEYIFPIIVDKEGYEKNEGKRYFQSAKFNKLANWHLKKLGEKIKLPFDLTFHLSRHSFATNALNNGMRIEHVSKLMDHRDIGTTQIYAKIISEELDKAVDSFIY